MMFYFSWSDRTNSIGRLYPDTTWCLDTIHASVSAAIVRVWFFRGDT